MMKVRFKTSGPGEGRVFKNVLSVETGTYQHPNGIGNEAMLKQWYEGEVDEFPVRGYDYIICEIQQLPDSRDSQT